MRTPSSTRTWRFVRNFEGLMMRKTLIGLGSLAIALTATPATAQDDHIRITFTRSAAVVSDYRFRGVSQTGEDAAIQGSIGISHESGLYAGVWGSSVDLGATDGVVLDRKSVV